MIGQGPKFFYDNSIGIRTMPTVRVGYFDKLRQVRSEDFSELHCMCENNDKVAVSTTMAAPATDQILLSRVNRFMKGKQTFEILTSYLISDKTCYLKHVLENYLLNEEFTS